MAARTERGEEDRQREDEQIGGEPTDNPRPASAAGTTTREKGKAPAGEPGEDQAGEKR